MAGMFRLAWLGFAAMASSGCADGAEPLATLTHDLEGGGTLRAYRAEPAPDRRQMDRVHEHMYGFRTESPRTPYICVWRDPKRFRATAADGPPVEIFLVCSFGAEDWEPPRDVSQEVNQRVFRDEALFGAGWVREGESYRLTRLQAEVKGPKVRRNPPSTRGEFRSANAGNDLASLQVRDMDVVFPASAEEPIRFRIEVTAPYRLNAGEPPEDPIATLRIEGTALPIPDWLMY